MIGRYDTLAWKDDALHVLDQLQLPAQIQYVVCRTPEEVAEVIRSMKIRGAPAIGVAAAYGMAMAVRNYSGDTGNKLTSYWRDAREMMAMTRPTAVNLFWALERMQKVFDRVAPEGLDRLRDAALAVAQKLQRDDVEANKAMGLVGANLIPNNANVLTHCNAGALATAGYGTAVGVIRAAKESGKELHVWVDETRPFLQGARLTAWELEQLKIPYTLICDNMSGSLMQQQKVDMVIVGADRIDSNGNVANKIGTFPLAVLCHYHHIPFYVAAPLSTIDRTITDPAHITIEQRPQEELTHIAGTSIAPPGARAYNPAFDVTPHHLVRAIVTPVGLLYPPFNRSIGRAFDKQAVLEGDLSGEV
jgi:methylthioribose-1-phosphate isomerase